METSSGNNILHTFRELDIDVGNINKSVFDGWFDTDDRNVKPFLNWLCTLNKNNVLSSSEYEEFLHLEKNGNVVKKEEYKQAVEDTQRDYEDIWDYDNNCFEIECLDDELTVLLEEQHTLEKIYKIQETLANDLIKKNTIEKENEVQLFAKFNVEQENCQKLSYELDETHEKIYEQIHRYSGVINNFEGVSAFISNISWESYNQFNHEISSNLTCYIEKEHNTIPILNTVRKSVRKIGENNSFILKSTLDNLDELHTCFAKVIKASAVNAIEEGKLRTEMNFLKSFNFYNLTSYICDLESLQCMLEDNIELKNEKLDQIYNQLEIAASEVASKLTNEAKVNHLKKQLDQNKMQLDYLKTKVTDKFLDILSNQQLYLMLFNKEKQNMETMHQFFRDSSQYIIRNIQSCQRRTEIMLDIILKSKDFDQLPVDQTSCLLKSAALVLHGRNLNEDDDPIKIITNFKKHQSNLYYNLFKDDNVDQMKYFRYIEKQIESLKSFLMSSPTTRIVAIPTELSEIVTKVNVSLNNQKHATEKAREIYKDSYSILNENKWLRIKRQLWLFFMSEPSKILSLIKELKKEVEAGGKVQNCSISKINT